MKSAVSCAIDTGYRYFDTSAWYFNESEIGEAIREKLNEGVISRDEIFITNKVWCTFTNAEAIETSCRKSLAKLQLQYFDLCLLHIPSNCVYANDAMEFPLYTEPKIHFE